MSTEVIAPQSGVAFPLRAGQVLRVVDPRGGQVCDLTALTTGTPRSALSAGKTVDFAETVRLTTGSLLYSSLSVPLMEIVSDTVGRHDVLLAPCSQETFDLLYPGPQDDHPSCLGNLTGALAPHGVRAEEICSTLNVFMNVEIGPDGRISVRPPLSRPGDAVELVALRDLLVGLTSCSAEGSNDGTFTPIEYEVR